LTASQNRIQFMVDSGMSDSQISVMSGVPRSTIGFVRRGERTLPSQYLTPLRDTYRRVNYQIQRAEGFSYHQARKYSSSSVATSRSVITEMKQMVGTYAKGALTGIRAKDKKLGIIRTLKDMASQAIEAVKSGMRRSHKDFKDIQNYPRRREIEAEEERKRHEETHRQQEEELIKLGW